MSSIPPAVSFPYTLAEHWAVSEVASALSRPWLRFVLFVAAAAIPVALALVILGGSPWRPERVVPQSLAGGVVLALLCHFLWEGLYVPAQFRRLSVANQTITVAFDETGFRWSVAGLSVTAAWSHVASATIVDRHLVVMMRSPGTGIAIPRQACETPQAFAALVAYVKDHVSA